MDQTIPIVAVTHDGYEQIWGWAQVGGALLALVALVFAGVAWWEARKSAAAAEASAGVAREELEMMKREVNRKPKLEMGLVVRETSEPRSVILQLSCVNTGDRDAFRSSLNIVVPENVRMWECESVRGANERAIVLHPVREDIEGKGRGGLALRTRQDFERNLTVEGCFRIADDEEPPRPSLPIRVILTHPDMPGEVSESFNVPMS